MKHIPLPFWASFNAEIARDARPGFMLIGEDLNGNPAQVAQTWREGRFTAMFDFPLGFAIDDVFCRGRSPAKLAVALSNDRRYPDPSQLVTLADNHDQPRLMTVCGADQGKVKQALEFLLTARGVPSLSWGTEVGLEGEKEPENRKSMRFEDGPLRAEIAGWLAARSEHPALKDGAVVMLAADEQRVAIGRATADELAIVFVNHGEAWKPTLPAPWNSTEWRTLSPGAPVSPSRSTPVSPSRSTPFSPSGVEGVVPPGITIWLSRHERGRWTDLARSADRQWRTGSRKRVVELTGSGAANLVAVGSGPELGDWGISRGLKLPAKVELPIGGVFELKLVSLPETGAPKWAPGEDQLLVVQDGAGPQHLDLAWP